MDESPPKLAATVILAREAQGGRGYEVCVVRRSRTLRVLPGFYAFPGGTVDEVDRQVGRLWAAADRANSPEKMTLVCAAVREALEEVGVDLLFVHDGIGGDKIDRSALRRDLLCGRTERFAFAAGSLHPPALRFLGRRVTPPLVRSRFDTHFFVAAVDPDTRVEPSADELEAAVWVNPRTFLEGSDGSGLAPPTVDALQALTSFGTLEELLAKGEMPPQRDDPERLRAFQARLRDGDRPAGPI